LQVFLIYFCVNQTADPERGVQSLQQGGYEFCTCLASNPRAGWKGARCWVLVCFAGEKMDLRQGGRVKSDCQERLFTPEVDLKQFCSDFLRPGRSLGLSQASVSYF